MGCAKDDCRSCFHNRSDAEQLFMGRKVVAMVVAVQKHCLAILLFHKVEPSSECSHPYSIAVAEHGEHLIVADAVAVFWVVGVVCHTVSRAFWRKYIHSFQA